MSGHSKWATIKRAKAANDAKRGALFTRLGREIMVAAREGGPNPEANFRLRLAIDRARAANMPKENIERAIARATGQGGEAEAFEEIIYEVYLPHKVPAMIQVLTDNRNRTVAEVRRVITRAGGQMDGAAVAWQFQRKGVIVVERKAGLIRTLCLKRRWKPAPTILTSATKPSRSPRRWRASVPFAMP